MQGTNCNFDLDTSDGAEELGCLYTVTTSLTFTAKDTPRYGKKCYYALVHAGFRQILSLMY
jgi:hypothetical protein